MARKTKKKPKQRSPSDKQLRALEKRVAQLEAQAGRDAHPPAGRDAAGDALAPAAPDVARPGDAGPAGADEVLDVAWSPVAARLAALAHPVRLELLRHVLHGARTTGQLAALEIVGTTGQLYHHVKPLISAGWLRQTGRGRYAVPDERVAALLTIISATR